MPAAWPIEFDWTSWYGVLLLVAGGIVTVGGAVAVLSGAVGRLVAWLRPTKPLIAFGHPHETPTPWIFAVGGSDADWQRQQVAYENARLGHLGVDYLVENKGTTNTDAVREVTTGLRSVDGTEHTFQSCFAQILGPGEHVSIEGETVPAEMHEGMDDTNRAENFLYWSRFRDARSRRWEATYEPKTRTLDYQRL